MRTTFDQTIIQAIEMAIRNARLAPLFLGGTTASGGGAGSPPGGFIGYLPQTRVAYDLSELASSGIPASGASLLDNLNHIRYRIETLESGNAGVDIYWDNVLVASGVTVLNFEGDVTVTDNGGNQVTILISGVAGSGGASTFLDLTDTPSTYSGQAGKAVVVNGTETGLEFTTISGASDAQSVKVSVNDTNADFLEQKIVAGTNVSITVLNEGGNEQLQISSSGVTGSGISYLDDLTDVQITSPQSGDILIYSGGLWENTQPLPDAPIDGTIYGRKDQSWTPISGVMGSGVSDHKVKISINDTTENFLGDKLVPGTNIGITVLNSGGNEQLEISYTASGISTSGLYRQFTWVTLSGDWEFVSYSGEPVLNLEYLE